MERMSRRKVGLKLKQPKLDKSWEDQIIDQSSSVEQISVFLAIEKL